MNADGGGSGPGGAVARALAEGARDLEVVRRIREGDEREFTALVEEHHVRLCRLARSFVPSPSVADEVAQETWVHVLTGLAAFEGRSSLRTWIYRILVNRARTRGERESRTLPFSSFGDEDEGGAAVDPSRFDRRGHWTRPPQPWGGAEAERRLIDREALALIEQELARLPPNQRQVVTMRDVLELESTEVCNVLGLSETNQRVLLHRGRAKLRAALAAYLGDR